MRGILAGWATGLVISWLLVGAFGSETAKMVKVPHKDESCIFEYKDTFGETGTANDCVVTRTSENVQMYCGDDFIVEVKEIREKCKEGEDNDGAKTNN